MTKYLGNAEAGRKTLDSIEKSGIRFNMGTFGHTWRDEDNTCGTDACLAGHCLLAHGYLLNQEQYDEPEYLYPDGFTAVEDPAREAQEILGLDSCTIFYNFNDWHALTQFRALVLAAEKREAERAGQH